MNTDLLLVILIGLVGVNILFSIFLGLAIYSTRRNARSDQQFSENLARLAAETQRANTDSRSLFQQFGGLTRATEQLLSGNESLIAGVGELKATTAQMVEIRRHISDLQQLLQSPQLRGGFGEFVLEKLLELLPRDCYKTQYRFPNGNRVDAIIELEKNHLIPIDSKFPRDNFQRFVTALDEVERQRYLRQFAGDVRKHIDDIAAKYIVPAQGTLDFAFMFVPSEAIYYEIVTNKLAVVDGKDLITYALERHVFPVSPNTLFPYLLTVSRGLNYLRSTDEVRHALAEMAQLRQILDRQAELWKRAREQITRGLNNLDAVQRWLEKLQNRVTQLSLPNGEVDEEISGVELTEQ